VKAISGKDFAKLLEKKGLRVVKDEGKSSYLRQSWEPGSDFCPDTWKYPTKDRLAEAPYEGC
jgi:hypothetical protein